MLPTNPQPKDYCANPHTPWRLSPTVQSRLQQSVSKRFRFADLNPQDLEFQMVIQLYKADAPPHYAIKKISCICNRSLQLGFVAHLINIEEESKKFKPRWDQDPLSDQRKEAISTWKSMTNTFSPLHIDLEGVQILQKAKVLPLWHGTSLAKAESICEAGFTYFGKHTYFQGKAEVGNTDIGYFGSGIYFTESAHYASLYSKGCLFLSWVSMREPYPVISDKPRPEKCTDMKILEGKGAYQNYDTHFVPVAPLNPNNQKTMIYHPCYQNQPPTWHEIVVFQKAQTLPTFLVELEPMLLHPLDEQYNFPTFYACCQAGEIPKVKAWIKEDRNRLYIDDDQGETCYFAAVLGGQLSLLKWLCAQDPKPLTKIRKDGWTLLHLAAFQGDIQIAEWIHSQNSQLLTTGNPTPLQLAAYQEQIPLLNHFSKYKDTLSIDSILKRTIPQTLTFLLDQGLDLNQTDSSKQTLLHRAAQSGHICQLQILIERGAQIDAQDLSQKTPLYYAVCQGHLEATRYFLEKGANPAIPGIEGDTVLHLAAFYGYTPLLKYLLEKHPQLLQLKDQDGKQAIHKAVWMDPKPDVVQLLLDAGADPNAQNNFAYTPLHWAAKHGHIESAKLLLSRGASLEIPNANKDYPLDLAIRWGQDAFLADFHGITTPEPPPQKDPEAYYYTKLLQAKKQTKKLEQIFYIQKLADQYLQQQNWTQAAKLLNGALILSDNPHLTNYLLSKLERIEGLFLESLSRKMPKTKTTAYFRKQIQTARTLCCKPFPNKQSAYEILPLLTGHYKKILEELILDTQEMFGQPPCTWTCIGMGSMARDEMCPYSDLEFAFLISENNKQNLNYFRTLSKLLEIRIINFGETHFPLFAQLFEEEAKQSLTPKGLSLDTGGNTPLGKPGFYELIGTPEELARFQTTQWLNDDIIVTNALSSVCYVSGDQNLLASYNKAKKIQMKTKVEKKSFCKHLATRLLEGHLHEFKPSLSKHKQETSAFGIKKELYRPFQSILASITLFAKLPTTSTFNMIEQLSQKSIISSKGAKNLTQALRHALNLRLEAHLFYQHEGEFLLHQEKNPDSHYLYLDNKKIDALHEIYRVLIPFHQCAERFLRKRDLKVFAHEPFYDDKPNIKGLAFEKALKYAKAQEAHQQAVSLNPHDIDAQLGLGNIENKMAMYQEALQRNLEALKIAQTKYGEEHEDVATSCNNIGVVYHALGNYEKALEFYKKALSIRDKTLGPVHSDVASTYNNIGTTHQARGNYEKALEFLQKGLMIQLMVLGDHHSEVARSYNNIGMIYQILGNYEKALEFFKKALRIWLKSIGDQHPDVAISYNNIGMVYQILGNYEKALNVFKKGLTIRLNVLGDQHPAVAESYNNIGVVYHALGLYEKALEFYQKDLKISRKILGKNHPNIALIYNNIGMINRELKKYEKALEFLQKALKIQLKVSGNQHTDVAKIYNNIGLVYQETGDNGKALEVYQIALTIRLKVLGDQHSEVAESYNNIGFVYQAMENCEKALEFLQKALEIWLKSLGDQHPNIATVYNNIGLVYFATGDNEKALEFFQKALKIWLNSLGEQHPIIATIYTNIGMTYQALGNDKKALEYFSKKI